MFRVPETFLNKLKCNFCDGYLNAKPVVVKEEKQICAKCYKILPDDEKKLYHQMGCDYTYSWNNENGHETQCKKRYFTFPDVVETNENVIYDSLSLKKPEESNQYEAIRVPEEIRNKNIYENVYSTISNSASKSKCLNCAIEVEKNMKNVCLFGHVLCASCKTDMCVACVRNLDGNSRIACKNASKGCSEILSQSDVGVHRDNCEYNEVTCPVNKCDKKCVIRNLIEHLKENHASEIILDNGISKSVGASDDSMIFLCHDSIFRCLYFHYLTSAEIVVMFLGPCQKACEFFFEVTVEVNNKTTRKKMECANWNNYMLASGISIDKNELRIKDDKPLEFTLDLKILRTF